MRVNQVWAALRATVSEQELAMVKTVVSVQEYTLFQRMSVSNQRHSLNVAATAAKLAGAGTDPVDARLLWRAALLHDVGRRAEDMSTWDKIMAVLLNEFLPEWSRRWARPGRGSRLNNVRHAVYVYYHHADLSAEFLCSAGAEEKLITIVRRHHTAATPDDMPELILLRQADDLH